MADKQTYEQLEQRVKELEKETEYRRLAEEALRESEQRFQLITNSSAMEIWQLDLNGKLTYSSTAIESILGYTSGAALNLDFKSFFPESEESKILDVFSRAIAGEKYQIFETTGIRKDGSTVPVKINVTPYIKDGSIVGTQGTVREITAEKLAEEAIRKSEEHYRNFFDNSVAGLFRIRLSDGMIIEINAKAAELLDLQIEEIIGKITLIDYYQNREQRKELIKKIRQEGELHDFIVDFTLPNGRNASFSISAKAYLDRGYLEGAVIDITDRKKTEEELRYRSSIEEAIAQASGLMVSSDVVDYNTILGILGEIISVNRAYIFKIHEDDQKMSNTFEWCAPGTTPQKNNLQDLDTDQSHWWIEQLKNRKNLVFSHINELPPEAATEKKIIADQQVLSLAAVPIWSRGNSLLGFMGFDDTEKTRQWKETEIEALQIIADMISGDLNRRTSEEALESERSQLLSIFDSIDERIYISDPYTHEILYVNKALKASFTEDVVGKTCYTTFQGLNAPCDFCTNHIILKQKPVPHRWERYNQLTDRSFSVVDRIIKWPDGRDVRLEFYVDITDQKKLEERTQQAQKLEAIGTLAGGIAHDFNNILSGIFGYTQLLQMKADKDSKQSKYIDSIYQAGIRAKDLVQQILTFSRQSIQELRPMKMQDAVNEALKLIKSSIPSIITINSDIQDDCGLVMADQTQIHQIVMNLCTNAYHAMEETGGQLTTTLKELELVTEDIKDSSLDPGKYVCLSVIDTGTGIDHKVMDRIFDPYFTTKEKGKGTGLGLALIHGIVRSHGGQINVYSEPGKGAEFQVLLPLMADEQSTARTSLQTPILRGSERILLVDDQEEVVEIEQQMLKELGYEVTIRNGSLDALETFRTNSDQFDLVITDMTMPNMTGDQLAVEMMKVRSNIPILMCTGFSQQMTDKKAQALGIRGLLMKPLVIEDLSLIIRKVLDVN